MPCKSSNSGKGKGAGCDDCTCNNDAQSFPIKIITDNGNHSNETTPLLWKTTPADADQQQGSSSVPQDAPKKCDVLAHRNNRRTVCCRELKKDDQSLIDPDVIRDCIIGLSDGLTVPFALTAGLSGIGDSRVVVLAGLAELVSGSISMGIGGFLSAQAEVQQYHYQTQMTRNRVARSCQGEMEREVGEILEPFGLSKEISEQIAIALRKVETEQVLESSDSILPTSLSHGQASTSQIDDGTEKGLTPFLLRHEGIQPISSSRMYVSGILIAVSYLVGGSIPLLPYIFIKNVKDALLASTVVTGIILLIFGMIKQRATGGPCDAKGLIWSAVSTLSVGGLAAGASFAIVKALET